MLVFPYILPLLNAKENNEKINNLIKLLDVNLEYIEHEIKEDIIYVSVKSIQEYVCCPYCGDPSNKVHSRYKRLSEDLPI